MKRIALILTTTLALLSSEALTLLATRAALPQNQAIQAQSLNFYYKQDAPVRYVGLKNRWKAKHPGDLSADTDAELTRLAYEEANVEAPLEEWRFQGGPAPSLFSGKLHLYNNSSEALLNVPLTVIVRAFTGDLRPDPQLRLTDYDRLESSARWEEISNRVITLPALAPGVDKQVEVMQFELLPYLQRHAGRWPLRLDVEVRSAAMAPTHQTLTLVPDHFAFPATEQASYAMPVENSVLSEPMKSPPSAK